VYILCIHISYLQRKHSKFTLQYKLILSPLTFSEYFKKDYHLLYNFWELPTSETEFIIRNWGFIIIIKSSYKYKGDKNKNDKKAHTLDQY
jgi:hypothetical protein